jgi:prephenate dehydrogenase
MFNKIAVIGLGLLGGSICRAARKINPSVYISAFGRDPSKIEKSVSEGICDEIGRIDECYLDGVDLAIVSTPVIVSIDIIREILSNKVLSSDSIIIDVGSVKGFVVNSVVDHENASRFIGCHPMAGSERVGYEYSREDLFREASVIITPSEKNLAGDIDRVKSFWDLLGARTIIASPEEHDRMVACTSHLPHMLSCLLIKVYNVFRSGKDLTGFMGNGFRDVARLSSGSTEMWRDILMTNKSHIDEVLGFLEDELEALREMLDGRNMDNIKKWLDNVKTYKDSIS